ncbi:MAG: CpsD/CapB family tyrosine-protein kinase [Candidatus Omnitrophica bacterium]|nr:CpsD/CapB family tyrosine-protein kinase [Candidatus Omnitrophota bacterium]MDD5672175.1 CpsD/CapB family tyrosine-protein kinase [Candidatus Omnitrophota bacterium]
MSKFTKALEKIQSTRNNAEAEDAVATAVKDLPDYEMEKEVEMREPSWERGVRRIKNTTPDKRIVHYHFPTSVITEQYRSLRTNLKTRLAEEQAKVILVSSSINGEGKTITAINLAYSFAEASGCRIALVDADLRRGRVASYLSLGKDLPGLSDYLKDPETTVKEVMVRNSLENLFVIPRGNVLQHPAELVSSEKFRNLIGELKKHFDYVIVDAPPIMSVSDAAIFGRECDGLVMVIQSGRTPKTVIAHAHELFKQAGLRMFGYVLTNVEFHSADYRYYRYYDYYADGPENSDDFKSKCGRFMKRLGLQMENHEEKFGDWWQKRLSTKRKGRGMRQDPSPKTQDPGPRTKATVGAGDKKDPRPKSQDRDEGRETRGNGDGATRSDGEGKQGQGT